MVWEGRGVVMCADKYEKKKPFVCEGTIQFELKEKPIQKATLQLRTAEARLWPTKLATVTLHRSDEVKHYRMKAAILNESSTNKTCRAEPQGSIKTEAALLCVKS